MKSTIFKKIIDETTIEVNESFDVTVARLRQQQGMCRETDSLGIDLEFQCDKKGKLCICHFSRHRKKREFNRIYCVSGEVVTENNKTKVKIYTIHNKYYLAMSVIFAIIEFVLVLLYILSISFSIYEPSKKDILIAILGIFAVVYPLHRDSIERRNKDIDLEIMKNEIVKRVTAIDKWDD